MKRHSRFLVLLALTGAAFTVSAAGAEVLAITGGTVHTMGLGGVIEHATVLVSDGKISAVGANLAIPAGARVIDATGHIVTPGLINSYTDLGLDEIIEYATETVDRSSSKGTIGAAFDVRYGLNPNSVAIPVARIQGLTRAIAAPGAGTGVLAGVGAEIQLGKGPSLLVTPGIGMFADLTPQGREIAGGSRSAAWGQLLSALHEAHRYETDRDGFLHGRHPPYRLAQAELDALLPVIHRTVPLVLLLDRESDIRSAIRLQSEENLRVIIIGGAEAWRTASELAAARIPIILNPIANLPVSFDALGATLNNAAQLNAAGVTIAFYGGPGFEDGPYNVGRVAVVAGIAAANGLPREAALAAMTVNAARIWGIDGHYGSLEVGKDADIVVWDGDPLEPSSGPLAVLVRGVSTPLVSRQTLLRDRYLKLPGQALPPAYRH